MKFLNLKTSILDVNSVSSKYAEEVLKILNKKYDIIEIIVRDLAKNRVTPLTSDVLSARKDSENVVIKQHDNLIEELKKVDLIVVSDPVYNFQIPDTLINYFNAVSQAGKTFNYLESGQVGYLKAKVIVIISSGGYYRELGHTYREDYLIAIFNFLGIKDIQFVHLEGIATGLNSTQISQKFNEQIDNIEL